MDRSVRGLLKRLRGVAGLGVFGGLVGFLGAAAGTFLLALWDFGFHIEYMGFWTHFLRDFPGWATWWTLAGTATGTGFGTLIALSERKRTLLELPLWRMWLYGAAVGSLFFPLFEVMTFGWSALSTWALPWVGLHAVLAGSLTLGLVAVAKRADAAALKGHDDPKLLLEPEAPGA